jgi:hypothetical protein
VPVLPTSATTGAGLPALRRILAARVAAKDVAGARMVADIRMVAGGLAVELGDVRPPEPAGTGREQLLAACADAVGVPAIVEAVETSSAARVRSATRWPPTSRLGWWRSDKTTDPRAAGPRPGTSGVVAPGVDPSPPEPGPLHRARLDAAVRDLVDRTVEGMGRRWAESVRHSSLRRLDDLSDQVDSAVARVDLRDAPHARWLRGIRLLQLVLWVAAVVGGVWLLVLAVTGFGESSRPTAPAVAGTGIPALLLVGGLVGGIVIAVAGRVLAGRIARSHATRAEQRLNGSLESAVDNLVVLPLVSEVAAYNRTTGALAQALAD